MQPVRPATARACSREEQAQLQRQALTCSQRHLCPLAAQERAGQHRRGSCPGQGLVQRPGLALALHQVPGSLQAGACSHESRQCMGMRQSAPLSRLVGADTCR